MPRVPGSPPTTANEATTSARSTENVTRRLLDAATLVFGEHGFEAARVADIARRCNLTTGAVYGRWPSKRELFLAVVEDMTPRRMAFLLRTADISAEEKFEILGSNLLASGSNELRDFMLEACVIARRDDSMNADVAKSFEAEASVLAEMVVEGKAIGLIDEPVSSEAIVYFCQALGLGTHLMSGMETDSLRRPTEEAWNALMRRIIASVSPTDSDDSTGDN